MSLALTGFGTAHPQHTLSQKDAAELHATFCRIDARRSRTLRALYRRSGVTRRHCAVLETSEGSLESRQSFYPPARDDEDRGPTTARRMALYEEVAPALAAEASRSALRAAHVCAEQVSHLVTVSCTGFIAPGLDTRVIDALGLPPDTQRTHVGFMGCHGALNGLRVADSFSDANPDAVVVVCAVELCSLHFAYGWDPDMLVPNALFADGAAAVVGQSPAACTPGEWRVQASETLLLPDSGEDMSWRIGDHGFRMTLSPRVPDLIAASVGGWLETWLGEHGLGVQDIETWAVHPGGPRIISAVERAAGLEKARTQTSRDVLADFGNMSSATVLFILDRLRSAGAPRPCVALAFGPGLVCEAVLIT
ncbi:MAG: type III polyketide synthase [Gemmatimonadota bacterium]|nr:type III polyketide synthase [Gemmatimonadota bacterium]MDH3422993.1 type III polyketide synthase [Gemmatimonadota bacterium]